LTDIYSLEDIDRLEDEIFEWDTITVKLGIARGLGRKFASLSHLVSHCMEEHLRQKGLMCQIGAEE
jgi:hypothetical protein